MNWRSAKETPEPRRQVVIRMTGSREISGTWSIKDHQGWFNTAEHEWVYTSEVMEALSTSGGVPAFRFPADLVQEVAEVMIWTCDTCGNHPFQPFRVRLVGMGCCCGGTFRRVSVADLVAHRTTPKPTIKSNRRAKSSAR